MKNNKAKKNVGRNYPASETMLSKLSRGPISDFRRNPEVWF